MQTSNWVKTKDKSRYGEGQVYAFSNVHDAVKWAAKMDWEFNREIGSGKISILKIKDTGGWEQDPAQAGSPLESMDAKGQWLRRYKMVPPADIVSSIPVTLDLTRKMTQISNEEWENPQPDGGLQDKDVFGALDKSRLGLCYQLAGRYAAHHDDAVLVHGSIQGRGKPRIDHAWVKLADGQIWEPVADVTLDPRVFDAVFNPIEDKTYTSEQVNLQTLRFQHWGPWGEWVKPEKKKKAEKLPPEPDTAPIPEGMVRRFHVTSDKNVDAIKREGLLMSKARGIEGPRAIYSWPDYRNAKNYGGPQGTIVEFWTDPRDFEANPYATYNEVKPEQIIAIHEPWHSHARYYYKHPNEDTLQAMKDTAEAFPNTEYAKAYDFVAKNKTAAMDYSKLKELAYLQRGKPEAMGNYVDSNPGLEYLLGTPQNIMMHIGDLLHRTYENILDGYSGRDYVINKIGYVIRTLRNPSDSIEAHARHVYPYEVKEGKFTGSFEDFMKVLREAGKRYADAYEKLPVYNQAQRLMVAACVAIGEFRYNDAADILDKILSQTKDPEVWHSWVTEGFEKNKTAGITDTPDFKAWFGNSKVVDESGKPRIVYHGISGDETDFKAEDFYTPAYFYKDKRDAEGYGFVRAFYLKIEHPKLLDNHDLLGRGRAQRYPEDPQEATYDGEISDEGNDDVIYMVYDASQIRDAEVLPDNNRENTGKTKEAALSEELQQVEAYLNLTDEQKAEDLIWDEGQYKLDEFLEDEYFGQSIYNPEVSDPEIVVPENEELLQRAEAGEWDQIKKELPELYSKFGSWLIKHVFDMDPLSQPLWMYFDYPEEITSDTWLVHFTEDPDDIVKEGFKYGTWDIRRLALTSYWNQETKTGGYNFAFTIPDARPGKYGTYAVVFQAPGLRVYHSGDEEYQVIFVGSTAKNIHAIYPSEDRSGWVLEDSNKYFGSLEELVGSLGKEKQAADSSLPDGFEGFAVQDTSTDPEYAKFSDLRPGDGVVVGGKEYVVMRDLGMSKLVVVPQYFEGIKTPTGLPSKKYNRLYALRWNSDRTVKLFKTEGGDAHVVGDPIASGLGEVSPRKWIEKFSTIKKADLDEAKDPTTKELEEAFAADEFVKESSEVNLTGSSWVSPSHRIFNFSGTHMATADRILASLHAPHVTDGYDYLIQHGWLRIGSSEISSFIFNCKSLSPWESFIDDLLLKNMDWNWEVYIYIADFRRDFYFSKQDYERNNFSVDKSVKRSRIAVKKAKKYPDDLTGKKMWFEYHCWEDPKSTDADLWYHSHQQVDVLKMVEAGCSDNIDERYEAACLRYYKVRFKDGFTSSAGEDELYDDKSEWCRPDPPKKRKKAEEIFTDPSGRFWGDEAAGCIFYAEDTGHYLLAHRSEDVNEPGTWGTFGGKLDGKETPEQAVHREIREETGYTGPVHLKPLHVYQNGDFKYHNYLAVVPHEFEPQLDWESQGYKWVDLNNPEEIPSPLHFGLQELLEKGFSKKANLQLPTWEEFLEHYGGGEKLLWELGYYGTTPEEWKKVDEFLVGEEGLGWETVDDALHSVKHWYENEVRHFSNRKFPMEVYRMIALQDVNKLRTNGIGTSWTWNIKSANVLGLDFYGEIDTTTPYGGACILLKAEINPQNVDWYKTIRANLHEEYGEKENEITLIDGTSLQSVYYMKLVHSEAPRNGEWIPLNKTVTASSSQLPTWEEFLNHFGGFEKVLDIMQAWDYYNFKIQEEQGVPKGEQRLFYVQKTNKDAVLKKAYGLVKGAYGKLVRFHQQHKFPIDIYRKILVKDLEDVKHKGIGVYWSWDEKSAGVHTSTSTHGERDFLLKAQAQSEDIDWYETLLANLNPSFGKKEKEITLNRGAKIRLIGYQKHGENTWIAANKIVTAAKDNLSLDNLDSIIKNAGFPEEYNWEGGHCWEFAKGLHDFLKQNGIQSQIGYLLSERYEQYDEDDEGEHVDVLIHVGVVVDNIWYDHNGRIGSEDGIVSEWEWGWENDKYNHRDITVEYSSPDEFINWASGIFHLLSNNSGTIKEVTSRLNEATGGQKKAGKGYPEYEYRVDFPEGDHESLYFKNKQEMEATLKSGQFEGIALQIHGLKPPPKLTDLFKASKFKDASLWEVPWGKSFSSKLKAMYELEYKYSMAKMKTFSGMPERKESILKNLQAQLNSVCIYLKKDLQELLHVWMDSHGEEFLKPSEFGGPGDPVFQMLRQDYKKLYKGIKQAYDNLKSASTLPDLIVAIHRALTTAHSSGTMIDDAEYYFGERGLTRLFNQLSEGKDTEKWDAELAEAGIGKTA